MQAIEGLVTAQIGDGHAGDAACRLEALVREHPTRENLWLQLARSVAAMGRRDSALLTIQRAREALREHLGVDIAPRLKHDEVGLLEGSADDCLAGSFAPLSETSGAREFTQRLGFRDRHPHAARRDHSAVAELTDAFDCAFP